MKTFKMFLGLMIVLMYLNLAYAADPIASYSFDVDASDATGNYNATIEGDAEIVDDSERGKVVELVKDGYIRVPETIAAEMEDFSFTTWVNYDGDVRWAGLMGMGLDILNSTPYWDFHIQGEEAKGTLSYYASEVAVWPGDGTAQTVTNYTLPAGEWTHLALTFTLGTGGVVYANGVPQTQEDWNSSNDHDVSPKLIEPEIVWIGRDCFNQQTLTNTKIDEFKFFDTALTAEEVNAIYTGASAIENNSLTVPSQFELAQNFPNPFNPSTTIEYTLAQNTQTEIVVYDLIGNKVATLADGYQNMGNHKVALDASEVSAGVYIYQIKTEDFIQSKKMILVK